MLLNETIHVGYLHFGHTKIHLPHNIHFDISSFTSLIIPRLKSIDILRKLKEVNCPAEQVAAQDPQKIHNLRLGSILHILR